MKLPSWTSGLRGVDRFVPRSSAERQAVIDTAWSSDAGRLTTIGVTLPANLRRWADEVDPLLPTYLVAESVRMLNDRLDELVAVARERGSSWAQIAEALGVSKQAAWERFGRARRAS